jgi:hypothetical protein
VHIVEVTLSGLFGKASEVSSGLPTGLADILLDL